MGEFDLIARYFKRLTPQAALGVGDDCALVQPKPGTQLAISCDMLVQGRHFFANTDPRKLGHKALAVNLSDLAACGAKPLAFTLALALPEVDEPWLAAFSQGMFELADAHGCELIGGDTTAGPLNICITVFGEVSVVNGQSQALLRSGARPGDDLYVSGTVGDARLALDVLLGKLAVPDEVLKVARARLETPDPRVTLGLALRGVATSAIDVSDGLLGDLGHILEHSGVGATVQADVAIQSIATYASNTRTTGQFFINFSTNQWRALALAGGDDYELLFTAPPAQRAAVEAAALNNQTSVRRIGQIDAEPGLRVVDAQGQKLPTNYKSFDHFA
ncbi:MAG: thiamine-phosphate kinase [Rhodoferax sp.]|uniref:thiamine-phosphate kinase n=1 Tax=Rhodoferax sp. TaxID=50421 RepID=UPI00261905BF|nr:thiamine-phosphate kinase [Rhodoferax sp.]MDD2881199.1 thiamine-phosphate kinase [Rhodoferax sp.]